MPNNSNFPFNRQYLILSAYVIVTAVILFISYQVVIHFSSVLSAITGFFGNIVSALSPIIIGLIIAYLLAPLVKIVDKQIMAKLFYKIPPDPAKALKREKHIHTLSILVTFLIILMILCLIIYTLAVLIVGQLVFTSLGEMVQSIIDYFMKYELVLDDLVDQIPGSGIEQKLQDAVVALTAWLANHFSTTSIINFFMNIAGGILNILLGAVVSIYFLLDAPFFKRLWAKFLSLTLSKTQIEQVSETLGEINVVIGQFLRGQLLDGLIIAILSSVGLTMVGLDFAVFIGFFAGLANIIPYFGPILGMIPAVIVALLTGGLTQALLAVLVLFIIQQIDSSIISPRVVGSSTGLHPVFVLSAVIFAGYFWGIPGMLVAVPVTAIIKLSLFKRFGSV